MKQTEVTRKLIEVAIDKEIRNIRSDPYRSVRRLVDLGRSFTSGRFQKHFFLMLRHTLHDDSSAYYPLISRIADTVNEETIKRFGINIGYNSWTLGARTIRENERTLGFNIPWAVSLTLDCSAPDTLSVSDYSRVIREGTELGIYTYWLSISNAGGCLAALELAEEYPDCAFGLFFCYYSPQQFISEFGSLSNVLISLGEPDASLASSLTDAGCITCRHIFYDDSTAPALLSSDWIEDSCSLGCTFVFLVASRGCSVETEKRVTDFVHDIRTRQAYPIFLMSLPSDIVSIDHIISGETCFMRLGTKGEISVLTDEWQDTGLLLTDTPLKSLLGEAMPKVGNM